MRQFILIAALLFSFNYNYAAFPVSSATASQSTESTMSTAEPGNILLNKMVANSRMALEQGSHRKPNLFERLALKSFGKKMAGKSYNGEEDTEGFNVWGFLLGLFLGPIGLLASFIFSKDRNLRRWAWWGFRLLMLVASVIILV